MDFGSRFEQVKELGRVASGVAMLMRDREAGELVAVKFIKRGEGIDKHVEREILNHRRLSAHTNVITFREVFLTSTHLGIAMDYAPGGTLFERILRQGRFTEDIARYFSSSWCAAWPGCTTRLGVCHRDIKLENTLLDGRTLPRVQLCDFGYSKSNEDSMPKTTVGTPAYVAPEVLSKGAYDGEKADVWSCGVALYTMLVGTYPFRDLQDPASCRKMVQRILAVHYTIPPKVCISEGCADLLQRIFVADPAQRISLALMQRHPWFVVNLPRECQNVSNALCAERPLQTEAEIAAIVQAARQPAESQQQQQASLGSMCMEEELLMMEGLMDC